MNLSNLILSLTLLVISTGALHAQAFLDKGYHPKIVSLGRAAVAMKGDVGLLFYNPASIEFGPSVQAFAGFTNLYPGVLDDDLNVINAAGMYHLENAGTMGIGISQFSPNFWTERTVIFTFATDALIDDLSLGASAKLLSWSADAPQGEYAVPEPAISFTGVSFDLGALYVIREIFEKNDVHVGFTLSDITQPSVANSGSSDAALPMRISAGGAFISRKHNYSIFGSSTFSDGDVRLAFGYEISALKISTIGINSEFLFRFGGGRMTRADSQGEYNGGFGLIVENIKIDYSYSYQAFIQNVGGISSVAVSYEF